MSHLSLDSTHRPLISLRARPSSMFELSSLSVVWWSCRMSGDQIIPRGETLRSIPKWLLKRSTFLFFMALLIRRLVKWTSLSPNLISSFAVKTEVIPRLSSGTLSSRSPRRFLHWRLQILIIGTDHGDSRKSSSKSRTMSNIVFFQRVETYCTRQCSAF
jgi:hypothetical protein